MQLDISVVQNETICLVVDSYTTSVTGSYEIYIALL